MKTFTRRSLFGLAAGAVAAPVAAPMTVPRITFAQAMITSFPLDPIVYIDLGVDFGQSSKVRRTIARWRGQHDQDRTASDRGPAR